jgi:hypothetical protein
MANNGGRLVLDTITQNRREQTNLEREPITLEANDQLK